MSADLFAAAAAPAPSTTPLYASAAQAAREELDFRLAQARSLIDARKIGVARAVGALAPWVAIAISAGADLSDLPAYEEACAELRCVSGPDGHDLSEREIRKIVAVNACPRARWRHELAAVRDRALAEAARDPATAERAARIAFLAERLIPEIPSALRLTAEQDAA